MGELMDRAAGFWRSHWKALFQLYLAFHLTGYVLLKLLVWAMRTWFPLLEGLAFTHAVEHAPIEVARQVAIGAAVAVPVLCAYVWVLWLAAIAASRYVVRESLGQSTSAAESVRYAFARLGPANRSLVLVALLVAAVCFGVVIIVAIPIGVGAAFLGSGAGVLLALLAFAASFFLFLLAFWWFVLRFLLIAPVLAVEDRGAVASLRRCGQLVSGRIGPGLMNIVKVRATVLVTVMMLVLLVVTSLGSLPSMLVTFAYSKPWDPAHYSPGLVPERLLIPAELFQVAVQALFGPLYIALGCLFYLDMRVRREGLDLELKLEAMEAAKAAR
jgi:hypothetical protein